MTAREKAQYLLDEDSPLAAHDEMCPAEWSEQLQVLVSKCDCVNILTSALIEAKREGMEEAMRLLQPICTPQNVSTPLEDFAMCNPPRAVYEQIRQAATRLGKEEK